MSATNNTKRSVRIDRSHAHLRAPRERQEPIPDRDPEVFVLDPGEARRFHVRFHYSPISPGERLTVELDDAPHASVVLRKR
jgi:hypothetical protein